MATRTMIKIPHHALTSTEVSRFATSDVKVTLHEDHRAHDARMSKAHARKLRDQLTALLDELDAESDAARLR